MNLTRISITKRILENSLWTLGLRNLLSLCYRNKISCFTTIGSSGSQRTKSASIPTAIFPLRSLKRLSLAGSSHITRTTSCREKPRLDACDQKMDKPAKTICDVKYRTWPSYSSKLCYRDYWETMIRSKPILFPDLLCARPRRKPLKILEELRS